MNLVVHNFHLALLLYSSMGCVVKEAYGYVAVDFDGFVEAEQFEEALQAVINHVYPFDGRQGKLLDEMLTLRLDQYERSKVELPPLTIAHEEGQAIYYRFAWQMPRAAIANDLYIRLQWMLDENAVIV